MKLYQEVRVSFDLEPPDYNFNHLNHLFLHIKNHVNLTHLNQ